MCARQSWYNGFSGNKKAPQESVFQRWEIGSFSQIAMNKEGDMYMQVVNIGTPAGEPDQLYKPIIAAYDEAISEL
ncbi:hypothetical protein B0T09DRAFT_352376 [Sordaria sp. MPI-SDFR-AT-0083]|nr:hypothetical protein B0T09DRAFT_352376 [Sordaria sp. MPI-SDFR-AT-0083]